MNPLKSVVAIMVMSAVMMPTFSHAIPMIDTFEDLGADGSIVSSRIIDGVEVSFSNNKGANMVALTYGDSGVNAFVGDGGAWNTPAVPSNVSGSRFISTWTNSGINGSNAYLDGTLQLFFTFSEGIDAFGFTTIDVEHGNASLAVFDINDTLLGWQNYNNISGNGIDLDWFVQTNNSDIAYARFASTGTGAYGIDDMLVASAVPTPAPTVVWLIGSGLIGFIGFARRKA